MPIDAKRLKRELRDVCRAAIAQHLGTWWGANDFGAKAEVKTVTDSELLIRAPHEVGGTSYFSVKIAEKF